MQTECVVNAGSIPVLTALLSCADEEIRELCMWCLANIAGDRKEYRIHLAQTIGYFDKFIESVRGCRHPMTKKIGAWSLSNICRLRPGPDLPEVLVAVEYLVAQLRETESPEVLSYACEVLSVALAWEVTNDMELLQLSAPTLETLSKCVQYHQKPRLRQTAAEALRRFCEGSSKRKEAGLSCNLVSEFTSILGNDTCSATTRQHAALGIVALAGSRQFHRRNASVLKSEVYEAMSAAANVMSDEVEESFLRHAAACVVYACITTENAGSLLQQAGEQLCGKVGSLAPLHLKEPQEKDFKEWLRCLGILLGAGHELQCERRYEMNPVTYFILDSQPDFRDRLSEMRSFLVNNADIERAIALIQSSYFTE
eukprot:GHVU01091580.1.p1 GENE.GHVU01091580.1~~GHVU01091580.1.p1  ORF type:complete len:369 (-),score=35.71 GHVU01091580.1:820-1926(-)